MPHPWTRSVNGICFLPPRGSAAGEAYGPWAGHLVGCEYDTRRLVRMSLDTVEGVVQGAVYPLSQPAQDSEGLEGPVTCAIGPRGALFVGNLRDSGWGGGQNTGSIVRLLPQPGLAPGLAEVRAQADGFVLTFATDLDPARLADHANYQLASYRRESTPAYGGDDLDRRDESLREIRVESPRCVHLLLSELRGGYVYELHLSDALAPGQILFPAEAYYTLRRIPLPAESQARRTSSSAETQAPL